MKSYTKKDNEEHEQLCAQYGTRYCYDDCNWFGNCDAQIKAEQLPETEAICANCGYVWSKAEMHPYNLGRHTKLYCPICFKKGHKMNQTRAIQRYTEIIRKSK